MAGYSVVNTIVKWMNILTLLLSIPILIVAFWLYSVQASSCESFLQKPLLVVGVFMFFISLLGCYGAKKASPCILWIYLVFMLFLICTLAIFTIFSLVVSLSGNGISANTNGVNEYNLKNYSPWLRAHLNNTKTWTSLRSCMSVASYCELLDKNGNTSLSELSPTEIGCCRPPTECGFKQINVTYYQLGSTTSSNYDCQRYSNDRGTMCYDCDSCKGGVAYYIRKQWRTTSIVNLCLLIILIILYILGCVARRNANSADEFVKLQMEELKNSRSNSTSSSFKTNTRPSRSSRV